MEMNKLIRREDVDMNMTKKILYNFDTLYDAGLVNIYQKDKFKYITDKLTAHTLFVNYLNQKLRTSSVTYRYQLDTRGRRFTTNGCVGLINLSRKVRQTICKDLYWDYDISNAFPTIMFSVAKNLNVDMPVFNDYVTDRPKYINILMGFPFCLSKFEAKKKALSILHFGNPYKEFSKKYKDHINTIQFLKDMITEMNLFFNALVKTPSGSELYQLANVNKQGGNVKGTTMSYFFGIEENKILEVMERELESDGFEIGCDCYDGCLVYKRDDKIPDLCNIEKVILDELGVDVKLERKEFEEFFSMEEYPDPPTDWVCNLSIEREEKYVMKKDYISNERIIVVHANLGSGKTTAIIEHIKDIGYKTVICLCSRITFSRDLQKRFDLSMGFKHYQDIKGVIKHDRIIIQTESLYRLHPDIIKSCDLLLIDECESVLVQMTSFSTHKKNHLENIRVFNSLVLNSPKLIMMDGYISNITKHFLSDMGLGKYQLYHYTTHNYERKYKVIDDYKSWVSSILTDLQQGKKLCIFVTSKNKANDIFINLNREGVTSLIYDSDNKNRINTNDWKDESVRCVIYTSTITVGVNFDNAFIFDRMYCYVSSMSKNRIRDVFQALFRVRQFKENLVIFNILDTLVGITAINTPTQRSGVLRLFNDNEEMHGVILSLLKGDDYSSFLNVPHAFKNLCINCIIEANLSIVKTRDEVQKYLMLSNYIEDDQSEEDSLSCSLPFEEDIYELNCDTSKWRFDEIQSIDDKEYSRMKWKKDQFTMEDHQILKKHEFEKYIDYMKSEDPNVLFHLYINGGRRVSNIRKERDKRVLDGDIIADVTGKVSCINGSSSLERLAVVRELKQELHIEDTQKPCIIKVDRIDKGLEWIDEAKLLLFKVFSIRDQRKGADKYTDVELSGKGKMALLNKVLDEWGFSQIKPKYRTKKERKEDIVGYEIVEAGIESFIIQEPIKKETNSKLSRPSIDESTFDDFDFLEF